MIYIKKQKHGLNALTDTALLDPIYNDLLGWNLQQFPFFNLFIYCLWQHDKGRYVVIRKLSLVRMTPYLFY